MYKTGRVVKRAGHGIEPHHSQLPAMNFCPGSAVSPTWVHRRGVHRWMCTIGGVLGKEVYWWRFWKRSMNATRASTLSFGTPW